ncbi:MAG: peptide deformylase [uncultured bacterium]|nr:MAG: peptide deformylase [uncultured bacterium]
MSILKILQYPDSRLRRKGHKVTDVTSAPIKKIIKNMHETLSDAKDCAALAATQLDIDHPPSIVVINLPDSNGDVLCLINPQIVSKEGRDVAVEGCMSVFPEYICAEVKRALKIKVKALDMLGNHVEFEAEGFLARCIQHECDHLNGELYIDHLSKSKRAQIEKKMHEYGLTKGSK